MTLFYGKSNNLDSLSDVKQFSSALNGKTYGLKKIGGIFIPGDVTEGQSVSGVIPDGGLYIDLAKRVGILTNNAYSIKTDNNGTDVKILNGLEKTATGDIQVKGKTNGAILSEASGVSVIPNPDSGLSIGSGGIGVRRVTGSGLWSTTARGLYVDSDNDTVMVYPDALNKVYVNVNSPKFGATELYFNDNIDGFEITEAIAYNTKVSYKLPAGYQAIHLTTFSTTLYYTPSSFLLNDNYEIRGTWTVPNGVEDYGFILGVSKNEDIPLPDSDKEYKMIRTASSMSRNDTASEIENALTIFCPGFPNTIFLKGFNIRTVVKLFPITN
jgi:hypothetical protein